MLAVHYFGLWVACSESGNMLAVLTGHDDTVRYATAVGQPPVGHDDEASA